MKYRTQWGGALGLSCAGLLAACGGGGADTGGNAGAAATFPSSGIYAWLLKPSGTQTDLKAGLSLVHPTSPGDEYAIEPVTASISATAVVKAGTVDAARGTVGNVTSHALLYIVDGDIRRLPLAANSSAPSSRVSRASITNACQFKVEANDFTDPDNSLYVVSTKGADGLCGTADDGAVEVRAGANGVTVGTSPSNTIAVLRDSGTLLPAARVTATSIDRFSPPATSYPMNVNGNKILRLVGASMSSVLYEWGTSSASNLWVFDLRLGVYQASLDATLTAGGGWQLIGFDAGNYYVYRNSGTTTASTWKVLKITRSSPAATLLASGTGLLATASMGSQVLYATVQESGGNRLLRLGKSLPGTPTTLDFTVPSTLTTVLTSRNDVHQFWRVSGIGGAAVSYQIEMKSESGASTYSASGGFPLSFLEASSEDLNNSENRTRFVFATGFGARAFGDSPVVVYDSASQTATTIGQLPGAADYGADPVMASLVSGPTDFFAGSATRISGGTIQGSGAKAFSGMAGTAGSLAYTSTKK